MALEISSLGPEPEPEPEGRWGRRRKIDQRGNPILRIIAGSFIYDALQVPGTVGNSIEMA